MCGFRSNSGFLALGYARRCPGVRARDSQGIPTVRPVHMSLPTPPPSPGTAETGPSSNTPERDVPVPVVTARSRKKRADKVRKQARPSNTKALEFGPNGSDAIDKAIEERMSAMDVPTGNSAEDRKKRRRIRNCISAQLHRERKRAYLESLEKKIKNQDAEISALRARVEYLEAENASLRSGTESGDACTNWSPEEFELAEDSSCAPGIIEHIKSSDLSCFDSFPTSNIELAMDAEVENLDQLGVFADEVLSGLDVDSIEPPLIDDEYEVAAKLESRRPKKKRKRGSTGRVGGAALVAVAVFCLLGVSMIQQPTLNVGVGSHHASSVSRTRHLLSVRNSSGGDTAYTRATSVQSIDSEGKALAMWGDILRLHKNRSESTPAPPLEVLFSKLENMKVKSPDAGPSNLRGMNRALVPYGIQQQANKGAISEALKSLSVLRQGVYNQKAVSELRKASNTSMILCPRVYGVLNESSPSTTASHEKIMLVLPSSALEMHSPDEGKKSDRGWDGKWIEVDALVTGVRPLLIDPPSVSGVVSAPTS